VSAQSESGAPLRIVIPVASGALDALARAMSDRLSESLKRPVVVEARPGAAGNIAADHVARSAPDGGTLLLTFDSVATINPFLYPHTVFMPQSQLKPVAMVGFWAFMLVVNPSIDVKNLKDLGELTRTRPLKFASSGNGSASHLALAYLQRETGADFLHVPYRGQPPAVADVVGGHVDGMFAISQLAIPLIKAGKLRALGYSSRNRSPLAPDVPTLAELGYSNFDVSGSYPIFVPVATPDAVVSKLHSAFQDALSRPEVRERIALQDVVPAVLTPAEAQSWIEVTRNRYGVLIKESRITAE